MTRRTGDAADESLGRTLREASVWQATFFGNSGTDERADVATAD
jgi:hypothetical protein